MAAIIVSCSALVAGDGPWAEFAAGARARCQRARGRRRAVAVDGIAVTPGLDATSVRAACLFVLAAGAAGGVVTFGAAMTATTPTVVAVPGSSGCSGVVSTVAWLSG